MVRIYLSIVFYPKEYNKARVIILLGTFLLQHLNYNYTKTFNNRNFKGLLLLIIYLM
ncbi:hypothetical protein EMIT0210MI2_11270 [Priestia megaterium]